MTDPRPATPSPSSGRAQPEAPVAPPCRPVRPGRAAIIALGLALLTFLLFVPALCCDFTNYDDPTYVTQNAHVLGGLSRSNLAWAWTTAHGGFWLPLTWMSLQADAQFFGPSAWGFHFTNVLFHACNAALLFLVLASMTGSTWRSALAAALFAAHPLRVESVAWVTERKDVLSTCLGLLAILAYARYARRTAWTAYALTVSLLMLSLMAKPMLVSLPALLLVLDFWPLRRFGPGTSAPELQRPVRPNCPDRLANPLPSSPLSALLMEKIPLAAPCLAISVLTVIIGRGHASVSLEDFSLSARLANALVSYCRYLGKTFWPADLSVYYPMPEHWPVWAVAGSAMLLIGVTIGVLSSARRQPWLCVGWLWFMGTLLPVIGVLQNGTQAMADRFTYFPGIGLMIMLAFAIPTRLGRALPGRSAVVVAALGVIAALAVLTVGQTAYWRNTFTLFEHALAVTRDNYVAHRNLASAWADQGQLELAIDHYEKARLTRPGYALVYNNQATLLSRRGQHDLAIQRLRQALDLNPGYTEARVNLGGELIAVGQPGPGAEQLRAALNDPGAANSPDLTAAANYHLGRALAAMDRRNEAIEAYGRAIAARPELAEAYNSRGIALAAAGRLDAAINDFRQAVHLAPDLADAKANLARATALRRDAPKP